MKIDQKRLQSLYPEMKKEFAEKLNQMVHSLVQESASKQPIFNAQTGEARDRLAVTPKIIK